MNFPDKDLSLQHISQSYEGLLQQHGRYVLDALGNAVLDVGPTGSGEPISLLRSDATASMFVASASVAVTAIFADVAESASYAVLAQVAYDAVSASIADFANSAAFAQNAATASVLLGSIESASYSTYAESASYAPNHLRKTGDVATGDIIGTDFVKTRSGTITRDGDGLVSQVALTGGRTITVTRTDGYISSLSDGARAWNYTRNSENQIVSWEVVPV